MKPLLSKFCLAFSLALLPGLLEAAVPQGPLGVRIPGNGSILITEDCRTIARIDPKVYTGVVNNGIWSNTDGQSDYFFMATGGGDQRRGFEAIAQVGGAVVELKWKVEIEESTLHVQYSLLPLGIVEVLGVQARVSVAYADWEGDSFQLNGKDGTIPREKASSQTQWTLGNAPTNPDLSLGPSHGRGGLKLRVKAEKSGLALFDSRYYGPILGAFLHHNEPVLTTWIWENEEEKKFDFTIEFNRDLRLDPETSCTPVALTAERIAQMPPPSAAAPVFTDTPVPPKKAEPTPTFTRVVPVKTNTPVPAAVPAKAAEAKPEGRKAGVEVGERRPDPFLMNAPAVRASTSTPTAVKTATRISTSTPTRTSTNTVVVARNTSTPTRTSTRRAATWTPTRIPALPTRTPTRVVVLRRPTATPTFLPLPSLESLQPQVQRPAAVPKVQAPAKPAVQQPQPVKPVAAAPEISKPLPQWFPPLEESKTITIPMSAASIYVSFEKGYGHYEFKLADRSGKILRVLFDEDAGGDKEGQWIYWDGLDDKQQEVPVGKYFLLLYKNGKAVNTIPMIRKAGP